MLKCDTLIRNANVLDGSGNDARHCDVALRDGRVVDIAESIHCTSDQIVEGEGLSLAPGFIDVHTHDDTSVIETPDMLPKISQGVTTVIVGNCGISASPARLKGDPPDPMNLLGRRDFFRYPAFSDYIAALQRARPAVNVASLVGHTSLRNNHLDRLDRSATAEEVEEMRAELVAALDAGALGLSSGLAYSSANSASTDEVIALAEALRGAKAVYATHMRTETDGILDAMKEACTIGRSCDSAVVISHLKCAGIANWGRSGEVLHSLEGARATQQIGCDCYPYAAGSSTLDLKQVDPRVRIEITWSAPHPDAAGKNLFDIAVGWNLTQLEAAKRLQPAGAIYHSIDEQDMRRILAHPATMIGSDGLPWDKHPHPRLWGAFPRVLGRYCRGEKLFSLPQAIHKMTTMPARRFGLAQRGAIAENYWADLVLFDADTIDDTATFADPLRPAKGIMGVWVNGTLSYTAQGLTGSRAGRYLPRAATEWLQ
ncbi:D-aminoacylase [Telmatobacter sp. DSM 110680]|uniref:D-aminoacylase n=1 Tax=Telmatobacter sp. DSM 110680 TaxID=3036704 RepID=A0AAU7DGA2_9BACT